METVTKVTLQRRYEETRTAIRIATSYLEDPRLTPSERARWRKRRRNLGNQLNRLERLLTECQSKEAA